MRRQMTREKMALSRCYSCNATVKADEFECYACGDAIEGRRRSKFGSGFATVLMIMLCTGVFVTLASVVMNRLR